MFAVSFLSVGFIGRFLRGETMRDWDIGFFKGLSVALLVGLVILAGVLVVLECLREFSGQLVTF